MKLKAVFLDKDGTIIPSASYNNNTDPITFSEEVIEGLQLLQSYGYLLVVVTNQPGIVHEHFTHEQLDGVKEKLSDTCSKMGIYLDGFYSYPHSRDNHDYHKSKPRLLYEAATDMDIDLSCSWMIGDILNDVEAGKKAGCKTILIDNGKETEWKMDEHRNPEYKAKDLAEAARYILTA